jgi:hypothetical protein
VEANEDEEKLLTKRDKGNELYINDKKNNITNINIVLLIIYFISLIITLSVSFVTINGRVLSGVNASVTQNSFNVLNTNILLYNVPFIVFPICICILNCITKSLVLINIWRSSIKLDKYTLDTLDDGKIPFIRFKYDHDADDMNKLISFRKPAFNPEVDDNKRTRLTKEEVKIYDAAQINLMNAMRKEDDDNDMDYIYSLFINKKALWYTWLNIALTTTLINTCCVLLIGIDNIITVIAIAGLSLTIVFAEYMSELKNSYLWSFFKKNSVNYRRIPRGDLLIAIILYFLLWVPLWIQLDRPNDSATASKIFIISFISFNHFCNLILHVLLHATSSIDSFILIKGWVLVNCALRDISFVIFLYIII